MNVNRIIVIAGILFGSSLAIAGDMGIPVQQKIHPMISLQGGYASVNAGETQSFLGVDDDVFTYTNSNNAKNTGFIGAFIGLEHSLPWHIYPNLFMQTGFEYNYIGKTDINGIHTVGIEPGTSTTYSYNYTTQTHQVLGTGLTKNPPL